MNKYVYLGTNENLNHRGFPTNLLCILTKHEDCFYVKFDTLEHLKETKLDNKYLKYFKNIQSLTPPTADEIVKELNEHYKSLGGSPTVYYINNGFYDDEGLIVELDSGILTFCDEVETNLPLKLAHKITSFFMAEEK